MLTFDLRFERAQATAVALADRLGALPGVKRVIYPMRADHPDHARAAALLQGQGCNMVSFELKGAREAANAFTRAAEGLSFAPTLGDVGTTLSHPASSSHRALTVEERARLGLTEGFFRVSVGLEDPEALKEQLYRKFEAIRSPVRTAEAFLAEEIIDPRDTRPLLVDFIHHAWRTLEPGETTFGFRP